jgi:hypothetical protein
MGHHVRRTKAQAYMYGCHRIIVRQRLQYLLSAKEKKKIELNALSCCAIKLTLVFFFSPDELFFVLLAVGTSRVNNSARLCHMRPHHHHQPWVTEAPAATSRLAFVMRGNTLYTREI